ncbi:MAG: hypothetical protein GY839_05855 [candidate division Zixibacteria bacterium]|nr:hypothetical protein [candidate division Zixibacteria bacterium]
MEKHITLVAWLNIVYDGLGILAAIVIFTMLTGIGIATGEEDAMAILAIVGTALGFFFLVVSLPGVIGGIGLLKRQNWARILLLVIGFLNLVFIPLGTALGIYTIWALLKDETIKLFAARS